MTTISQLNEQLTVSTELEAVNYLLGAIGEQPISSITNTQASDVEAAVRYLRAASRELQNHGYSFNTQYQVKLVPDITTKEILAPANTLRATPANRSGEVRRFTVRNGKFYNTETNSVQWDTPLCVDLITFEPFSDLPEHARRYIMIMASLDYVQSVFPNQTSLSRSVASVNAARTEFRRTENNIERKNIYQNNLGSDADTSRSIYNHTYRTLGINV